jgi:hypothetical protein
VPSLTETLTETPTLAEPPSETTTETPTGEETPTETATLTASPTLPLLPTEPALTPLFDDNFDSGDLSRWTLGAGWQLVPSENGQALQVNGSDEPVTLIQSDLGDTAVQMSFLLNTGMVRLSLRQSEAGAYTILMDMNGQIVLYRGSQLLGSAAVNPIVVGEWRTIRLSAINDIIHAAIDGIEVIAVQDTSPLPPGTVSFGGVGMSQGALRVDDVGIWGNLEVSALAVQPTATTSPYPAFPLEPPLPISAVPQSSQAFAAAQSTGQTIFKYVSDVAGLQAVIAESALETSNTYVIRMQPGTYSLSQTTIQGRIIIVGNTAEPVNNPNTPESHKVIFQPVGANSIFLPYGGSLTLYDVVVQGINGSVPTSGGGVYNLGELKIYRSLFQNLKALAWGGAIYNGGSSSSTVTIIASVFSGNQAVGSYSNTGGGALSSQYGEYVH